MRGAPFLIQLNREQNAPVAACDQILILPCTSLGEMHVMPRICNECSLVACNILGCVWASPLFLPNLFSVTNCLPPFSNLEYFVPKLAKPEFSLLAAP